MVKAAHRRQNQDGSFSEQSIKEHCENVAKLAKEFAEPFGGGDIAYSAGMLHDIGKYSDAFQRRIHGSNEETDHSTAGTQVAWNTNTGAGAISAFCIGGHHAGLPDLGAKVDDASDGTLQGKLRRTADPFDDYKNEINVNMPTVPSWVAKDKYTFYFFTKMIFSSLVDADFLDTEAYMSNGSVDRNNGESLSRLLNSLNEYVAPWSNPTSELNKKRSEIFNAALSKSENDKGLFTLTAPTGGGKTVTSVGFALNHALTHGMDRIIYVIPYMSIIDQTQRTFERVFGEKNVVAHCSAIEYPTDVKGDNRYLATENWDAPVVLTTAVQFFESMYSNRPGKCRKLHNIGNSVIVFDEVQTLPAHLIRPCVLAITQLVQHYGCTAVLCTATQPALNQIIKSNGFAPDLPITELCPDELFSDPVFKRVNYKQDGKLTNNELETRLSSENQVLCVVNTRKQAKDVFNLLPMDGRFHLSTWMTPHHRRQVLDLIHDRLEKGETCRVVSTSLIEAGVDIDFPTVYKSLSGLDSILQAGGRCNREGKRVFDESTVHVFEAEEKTPKEIAQNCTATQRAMSKKADFESKEAVSSYFSFLLYTLNGQLALDQKRILDKMNHYEFEKIATEFKMIEGEGYVIYIPTPESEPLLDKLKNVSAPKEYRWLMKKLSNYAVNAYEQQFQKLLECGAIEKIAENVAVLKNKSMYSAETGLRFDI